MGSSMIEYKVESYADILEEFKLLIPEFVKEVDVYPEEPELDMNHSELIDMDVMGIMQTVTARKSGKLVGIHVAIVRPDLYYQHIITAFVIFYYMKLECRGGGNGTKMFEFAEERFKEAKAGRIFMSRKIYIPNEKMFDHLGFTHIEDSYTKAIL